jgi:metal-dependent hydrolase (beta-lactamase superfamily II)
MRPNRDWQIKEEMERKNIKPEDISLVFVTHYHNDHSGGAQVNFFKFINKKEPSKNHQSTICLSIFRMQIFNGRVKYSSNQIFLFIC